MLVCPFLTICSKAPLLPWDTSKLKEFADDNFKFDKNGRKFFKWVEKAVGKGKIAQCEQFLLFPQCFQKTRKKQGLLGKGLNSGLCGKK